MTGEAYSIDDDGRENSTGHCRPVLGILVAANQFGVVIVKQETEDR
jgi:hypothetical protein